MCFAISFQYFYTAIAVLVLGTYGIHKSINALFAFAIRIMQHKTGKLFVSHIILSLGGAEGARAQAVWEQKQQKCCDAMLAAHFLVTFCIMLSYKQSVTNKKHVTLSKSCKGFGFVE